MNVVGIKLNTRGKSRLEFFFHPSEYAMPQLAHDKPFAIRHQNNTADRLELLYQISYRHQNDKKTAKHFLGHSTRRPAFRENPTEDSGYIKNSTLNQSNNLSQHHPKSRKPCLHSNSQFNQSIYNATKDANHAGMLP